MPQLGAEDAKHFTVIKILAYSCTVHQLFRREACTQSRTEPACLRLLRDPFPSGCCLIVWSLLPNTKARKQYLECERQRSSSIARGSSPTYYDLALTICVQRTDSTKIEGTAATTTTTAKEHRQLGLSTIERAYGVLVERLINDCLFMAQCFTEPRGCIARGMQHPARRVFFIQFRNGGFTTSSKASTKYTERIAWTAY